ncbi:MAG: hypothetical protein R3Y59_10445 [bacterium]
MKFGFRKPSWKKSLSAATRGTVNRAIKKAIIPGYGQKGMGIANPKKYLYNRVYSITTIDTIGLLTNKVHRSSREYTNLKYSPTKPIVNYHSNQKALDLREKGLKQCKVIFDLKSHCQKISFKSEAIQKLYGRANKYISRGIMCGEDLHQYAKSDLEKLIETAAKTSTIDECKIAISIIEQLQNGASFDDIISNVKDAYAKLEQVPKPSQTQKTRLSELPINPNGSQEAAAQHKILMEFAEYTKAEKYSLFMLGARIKLFECCGKRRPDNVSLFDFARFKLSEKMGTVKRDTTKAEYNVAILIVDMLDQGIPMEQIHSQLNEIDRLHHK